jgi:hypothetical protein
MISAEQESKNVKAFEAVVRVAALGDGPILPLDAWYSLAAIEPIGGVWYFSFDCPVCNFVSPIFQDFSDGNLGSPFKQYGVQVNCRTCKSRIRCPSEKIRSSQWPLAPGQIAPRSEYANRVPRKYVDDPEYRPLRGPLHHYTSVDALLSILQTQSLWATNIRYLNDSSESELGLSLMREVVEEARSNSSGVDLEILGFLAEWLDSRGFENASVYVLSLSTAHNQLSQWRGYTRYGKGVCLSIDSGLLVRRMQAQGWTFQNCRYKRSSQLTWAEAILSRVRREAATNHVGVGEHRREIFRTALQDCLCDLLQVAATIKHEAFEDEHEERFISQLIEIDDPRVAFRVGKIARIPYVEFQLADDVSPLSFSEIMVGPGQAQDAVRSTILKAFTDRGVKSPPPVTLSKIPYREV